MQKYSQTKAFLAIVKASFRSILSNPSALFFSFLFPIIFIFIFGSFGGGGGVHYTIALADNADTTNEVYDSLKANAAFTIKSFRKEDGSIDTAARRKALEKDNISAVVNIIKAKDSSAKNAYEIFFNTTTASARSIDDLRQKFAAILNVIALKKSGGQTGSGVTFKVEQVREYRPIDFVLPGMLGFSILFSTLFGISFTFFQFRQQLILKRFYATPVSRMNILLGIGISRLVFQLINVVMLIALGYFFLHFTLVNDIDTFLEMTLLTIYMLLLLLGVGLIFSSIVKSDTSIPLFINLFAFPQMLLSGTFFPIDVFPNWLQTICRYGLPLSQYNDAIRKISFSGLHLWDCGKELGIMAIWMVIIYAVAIKVFKWE
ncbi:ABC transporter permease [Ferruginibacter sp. SUN106]|uniref:ABC transporter permease n=1 Tax=Ferruginibacter sp. SUN106 TaxID=2978348 RepID=UPI003D35D2F3